MRLAKRVEEIGLSGIRRFFDLVERSQDIVSLGVGEPDFPTPELAKDAAVRAIEENKTTYTSNYGILELREKLAEKLRKRNRIGVSPDQVLVTVGVSEALDLAVRAIVNPGEEVLIPEPCYVSYKPLVRLAEGIPIEVPTSEENDFKPVVEDLERLATKRTKAIILATPNNPTGSVLTLKDLEEIAEFVVDHDLLVIVDEIYEDLVYDREHCSIASLEGMLERTITLHGFSKGFAFTGWRLGYASGPQHIIEAMVRIHQYTAICAPSISQYAALTMLELGVGDHVSKLRREYDKRRRLLVKGLNSLPGIRCKMPDGAFYAFPNIEATGLRSTEFSERLLKEARVAVVPGVSFGDCGEGHVRCSYSVSVEKIEEALRRMENFLVNL